MKILLTRTKFNIGKILKIKYLRTQLNFFQGLIEFIEGLIAKNNNFWVQFELQIKEIEVYGLNCIFKKLI